MKKTIPTLLAKAFVGGMAVLAAATAYGQTPVTLTSLNYNIINGPKAACPAQVTFTGRLQVGRAGTRSAPVSISYQWVRSDGKTVGPSAITAQGAKTVTYSWSLECRSA